MEHSYHIPHLLLLFDIETKAISLIKQIFNLMNQYKQVKERVKPKSVIRKSFLSFSNDRH